MRSIARASFALSFVLLSGWASAQGDGGSQGKCSLQYSSCKQTAHANYQFCKNASQPGCQGLLNRELRACRVTRSRCQNSTAGIQSSS